MYKIYFFTLSFILLSFAGKAIIHEIDIPTDGNNTYSPADLTISLGDTILYTGSPYHPTTEVSEETWNSNGITAADDAAFESVNAPYQFTPTEEGVIYYVCDLHVQMGMKGVINVENNTMGIEDYTAPEVQLELGPVPVQNGSLDYSITSTTQNTFTFRVYSITGQELFSKETEAQIGKLEFDVPFGLYILLLTDGKGIQLSRNSILVE